LGFCGNSVREKSQAWDAARQGDLAVRTFSRQRQLNSSKYALCVCRKWWNNHPDLNACVVTQADHVFDFHPSAIIGLAVLPRVTPSSTLFVTAAADGILRVWDYAKRRLVFKKDFLRLPRGTTGLF
jgi:hypothetical protein